MAEGILLLGIFIVAMVYVLRPWYQALTADSSGCAHCPGNCGVYCEHAVHGTEEAHTCEQKTFRPWSA